MKWLQDNSLGMALAGISGVLVLFAAGLAIVWTLPVAVETAGTAPHESGGTDAALIAHQVGDLSEFQVINEKPVFNESRLPVIVQLDDDKPAEDLTVAIQDAPDVRLTGVIITPSLRIASLTPVKGKQESVMAHEGQPLTGEYVGWQVSSVNPRNVVLESLDGQKMELDLQVHDITIKEQPRQASMAKTGSGAGEDTDGRDEQLLSRAEQIRERIAERRAELRREKEDRLAESQAKRDGAGKKTGQQTYQQAIQALINKPPKEKAINDKKDE